MDFNPNSRCSDGQLLGSYAVEGNQAAFGELVERYEAMVLRVCRHVLSSSSEAHDAAQQVFIALSLKASALKERESIASWMYRAAWNIANRTRRAASIRCNHEKLAASHTPGVSVSRIAEPDTRLILQEALAEIPDIYRDAIVLHYFCGYTVAESAARLRCPTGTVAARISRGLERLRRRLSDRDLILTAAAIRLLMLGMGGAKKAAAAVPPAAIKGGMPRAPGLRPGSPTRLAKAAPWVGLIPPIVSYVPRRAVAMCGYAAQPIVQAICPMIWVGSRFLGWVYGLFQDLGAYLKQKVTAKPMLSSTLLVSCCIGAGVAAPNAPQLVHSFAVFTGFSDADADPVGKIVAPDDAPANLKAESHTPNYAYSPSGTTPVPEPATSTLLIGAAILFGGRQRRWRAASLPNG